MTRTMRGVVRDGRINVPAGAGFGEGQEVEIVVRPVGSAPDGGPVHAWDDGLRATAGCCADDADFDAVMEQVQRDRKAAGRSDVQFE